MTQTVYLGSVSRKSRLQLLNRHKYIFLLSWFQICYTYSNLNDNNQWIYLSLRNSCGWQFVSLKLARPTTLARLHTLHMQSQQLIDDYAIQKAYVVLLNNIVKTPTVLFGNKTFWYVSSQTKGYFHINFLKPVDLWIVKLEYDTRFNMRSKLYSGKLLHFLIKLKNSLLTADWRQVCCSVDSCISDMDHRETVVFMLEHLEHLITFQDLIKMGCLLSFHRIKENSTIAQCSY